ncbi:hypothetical protein [Actinomadura geliboluensis]|uniref:hypothetical protein n=1 Tax=Actinomadura geliboluensis TaxID=882440 RepID=UPI00371E70E2
MKLILLILVVVPLMGAMGAANFFVGMLVVRSGVVDIVKVLGSYVLPDGAVTVPPRRYLRRHDRRRPAGPPGGRRCRGLQGGQVVELPGNSATTVSRLLTNL